MFKKACISMLACIALATSLTAQISPTAKPLFTKKEAIPADAIVLFDGKDVSQWTQRNGKPFAWKVEKGYMEVTPNTDYVATKQSFGDCQLHIEFWLPLMANEKGQRRANSGVFLQGRYEIQVLDSYGLVAKDNDCGAIYGMAAPLVNAARPPRTWQSYDVFFHMAKFDKDGKMASRPQVTVFWNGVLIHDNYAIPHTNGDLPKYDESKPDRLMLQNHYNPVRYRNIWIRPLK